MTTLRATKEQMVDFLYHAMKAARKRVSKAKLNHLPEEKLVEFITSDPEITQKFNDFVSIQVQNDPKHLEKNQESKTYTNIITGSVNAVPNKKDAEARLNEFVEKLIVDPTNFITVMEFKCFLEALPYGTIPSETLFSYVDRLSEPAAPYALSLFEYASAQSKAIN